jgi:hypothetical protein
VPDSDIAGGEPPLNYQARDRKFVIVARRKSLHLPPLCRTRLGTIVDGRARSPQCLEQVLGERAGSPVGWQAIRAVRFT